VTAAYRVVRPLVKCRSLPYACFAPDPCGSLQVFGEAVRDCGGLHTEDNENPAQGAGLERAEGAGFEPTVGATSDSGLAILLPGTSG
jgi:hypothetical protein